jgi:hypothetical protein
MKRLFLAVVLAGALAFGAAQPAALAADMTSFEAAPGGIGTVHRHVTKRVAVHRCIEVSQPARGCPLRRYSLLPWPGLPPCYLYGGVCVYPTAPDLEQWEHYPY